MDEFRSMVREYGIKERRSVKFGANDPKRCQVKCEDGCPFYIWVRKKMDSEVVEIRTLLNDHLCTKPYKNKLASVKYLAEQYGDRIRKNPTWKVKEMIETIRKEMEIEIPWIKAMRIRKTTLEGVHDSLKQHYSRVWDFGHELLKINSNNTMKICGTRLNENDVNRFKRMYICYSALKKGWKAGYRPVIGLDGCFLKTVCGGQLLSAVGRDGNNQMYPICHAVVEVESTDSWRWFTDLMREDLDLGNGNGITIISDQQKVSLICTFKCYIPSNMVLCPRIKKLLDVAVKNSREWRVSWDGDNKYLVKSGTKAVTVDLSRRSCDCRVFDIKGIPCPHAVAAIHDSRQQPTDFVSNYYKRDKYLASYNFSIEAVKGEEYWNYYSEEPLLPPELPKKLRGRPKRLRRREEWESGSARVKNKNIISDVPQVQRYSSGRIQHGSICRQRGHRKNKCPTISAGANAEIGGENTHGQNHATQGQMDENVKGQVVGNSKVGIRRPKLAVRRSKTKGLPIDEGPVITTQVSQTNSSLNEDMMVKNNETPASSKSNHFMYKVLGKVGYEALYKPM
ncbi:uncharacterized protein LOC141696904 [Apium graveolens]|uniref:uncharacterized protein LOC141696904 n=1 Tax=Apium graveolens TaxID=4045 RepID=UPI003D7A4661